MSDHFHFEILLPAQERAWQQLWRDSDRLAAARFYLAGGTALALQVGHRQSADFDFFSTEKGTSERVLPWLDSLANWQLRDMDADTIHGDLGQVKISLIGGYKFPTVDELITAAGDIKLAGVREIGAMKLLSITHRAVIRDYLDLAVIIRDYYKLEELLVVAERKHGEKFNRLLPLRALAMFDDVSGEWPKLLDATIKDDWQRILRQAVKETA